MGTTSRGTPFPELSDPPDGPAQMEALATELADAPRLMEGSIGGRPSPGATHRFYAVSTNGVERISWNTGTRYVECSTLRSGNLASRPTATDAGAGFEYVDQFGAHWKSDGVVWRYAGGR